MLRAPPAASPRARLRRSAALACVVALLGAAAAGFLACRERDAVTETRRALAASPLHVWTQHNDNARTGATLVEATLHTGNVKVATFGKLFTRAVDDQLYAQPLYLHGVSVGGSARNLVYAATVRNTVYAFDADDPAAAAPLAVRNLMDAGPAGSRPVANQDVGQACTTYRDFSGHIGIVGTPVIDVAAGTLFVVTRTVEGGAFVQRLFALDVTTLADKVAPVVIDASVPGSGTGAIDGRIAFDPQTHNQRAALLLAGGVVYVTWASHCDTGPYHGWVLGYDAATLQQAFVFNTTPDGDKGGVWQSGQGLSADAAGHLYLITGNGTPNARDGGKSYGSAFVKLDPRASNPVLDWFIPFDADQLNAVDNDLGTSGAVLIPGSNRVLGGAKSGKIYLLDRDDFGHFHAAGDSQIVQTLEARGRIFASPVVWQSERAGMIIYVWAVREHMVQLGFDGSRITNGVVANSIPVSEGMPGGTLSLSANGGAAGSGIVWATLPRGNANQMVQPGVLRAFDADDISLELWHSDQNRARDSFGLLAKFAPPTIANGKVYVPTFSHQLVVYGLLPASGDGGTDGGDAADADDGDAIDASAETAAADTATSADGAATDATTSGDAVAGDAESAIDASLDAAFVEDAGPRDGGEDAPTDVTAADRAAAADGASSANQASAATPAADGGGCGCRVGGGRGVNAAALLVSVFALVLRRARRREKSQTSGRPT